MINDIIDESVKSCQTEVLTGYKEKIHSTQINDKEKMIADFSNYISTKSWAKTTVLRRNESKNSNQLCIEIELEVRPINIQSFIPGTEESEWYRAKNSNSLDLVRKFQQRFPNGNYAIDALHLIDKLENYAMIIEEEKQWIEIKNSNVGQVNDVTSFIKKFPYGKHIDNARQLLKQLHENILCSTIEKSNSVELINHNIKEIDQYIHEYPEGECLKIAQDRKKDWFAIKDWKDVQKINKINIVNTQRVENIIAHIKKYPNRISYTDAISQLKMLLSNLNNKIETMTSIEDFIVKKTNEQYLDKTEAVEKINTILQDKIKVIRNYQIKQVLGLVRIEAGSFLMGSKNANLSCICKDNEGGCVSEEAYKINQHKVNISKPFYICDHEVTVSEYKTCVDYKKCKSPKSNIKECQSVSNWKEKNNRLKHPINCVSWLDASDYFNWLNEKYSDKLGLKFRFCTEAEWEYAALAGRENNEWICDDESQIGNYAWYRVNAYGQSLKDDSTSTREVKTKKPNKFRLFDMSGNVFEWVQDSVKVYSKKEQTDPVQQNIEGKKTKIRRGGAFNTKKKCMQITTRAYHDDFVRSCLNGFRICAEPVNYSYEER
jgi:formylglycine-generating enzyme required for sulfatase activity